MAAALIISSFKYYMPLNIMATMLLLLLLCAGSVAAQSSSSGSCTSALVSLSPCLNYITGNETKPSSSCCSQLGQVVQSEPQCLCMVLNGGAASSLGITVDQKQALALPGACKVQTPPLSKCNSTAADNGGATAAPSTPTTPLGSSGGISRTLPNGDSSDGASSDSSRSLAYLIFPLVLAMQQYMLLN